MSRLRRPRSTTLRGRRRPSRPEQLVATDPTTEDAQGFARTWVMESGRRAGQRCACGELDGGALKAKWGQSLICGWGRLRRNVQPVRGRTTSAEHPNKQTRPEPYGVRALCDVLRHHMSGAGGNRTPVRQVVIRRATTIPVSVALWLPHRRVGWTRRSVHLVYSLKSAVFLAVSGLSLPSTLTYVAGL